MLLFKLLDMLLSLAIARLAVHPRIKIKHRTFFCVSFSLFFAIDLWILLGVISGMIY